MRLNGASIIGTGLFDGRSRVYEPPGSYPYRNLKIGFGRKKGNPAFLARNTF